MSVSESVEPGMKIENHNDPNKEANAAESEVRKEGENKEVSQEDQNEETAKAEKRKRKAERRKNKDFFEFRSKEEESSSDDEPLEGEELERELALHKKMRDQVMQEVKKHCEAPFTKRLMRNFASEIAKEGKSELEIYARFLPHPYPL